MNAKSRRGDWFLTYTGRKFWPLDPRVEDIDLRDIAHHLSLICRFGGAIIRFYSVGEHSIYTSKICPPEDAFEGLMHDGTEAYLGDVVRPLKYSLPEYLEAEARVQRVLSEKFGVPERKSKSVQLADDTALVTERRQLFLSNNTPLAPYLEALKSHTLPLFNLSPPQTEKLFLELFEQYRERVGEFST